jgi:amino acid adenylation domain-containing protein
VTSDLVAARLRAARRNARTRAIIRAPAGADPVLSAHQESIWLADRLAAGHAVYTVTQVFRVRGPLDADVLRMAFGIVMERQEILRTTYTESEGHVRPVVRDLDGVPMTVSDGAFDAAVLAVPFDLATDLPLRVHLVREAPGEHVLALAVHHIAVDGQGLRVLWSEVAQAYRALADGSVPVLPELPVRYADYAAWQSGRPPSDVEHWVRRLDGVTPAEIPADPLLGVRTAGRHDFSVPDVRDAATAHGVTLFHLTLAAFQVLLGRWSGRTDVTVGTMLAAREHVELDSLVGFFGTTVVIRTDLSADPPFAELVRTVRDTVVDAQQHGDLPFERLVERLRPQREPGRNPLFSVMFSVHDDEGAPLTLPGCTVEPVPVAPGAAKFDLELNLTRTPGGLTGTIEYACDRYRPDTVERLAASYVELLTSLVDRPQEPVSRASVLPPGEAWWLTAELNQPPAVHDIDALVPDLVHAGPELAVGDLTYDELRRRANQLANWLVARGIGPECTVGVRLPRAPDLVVAILGVLTAGAAYVPVDPDHPADRIDWILRDSGARLVLDELPGLDGLPGTAPPRTATPDNLAYIIYTSGSTGRPKGVLMPHRNVVNLSREFIRVFGVTGADVVASVANHAFDLSVPELLSTLMTGARIALAPRKVATDGAALARFLDDEGVTVMQSTATTWRMLLDAGWRGRPLRAGASGETVPRDLAETMVGKVERFFALYGPTETTVWSTGYHVTAVEPGRAMPVGRPLAGNTVHVCDEWLRPVPVGVTGEICIGGIGVSRGYHNSPRTTADKYVPDPFRPGGRLYRTGDLARVRPDGMIEFVGRADTQVKIRGNRVELGEVEAALGRHPEVTAAAATTWGDGVDKQLVAYVVRRSSDHSSAVDLRHWLATQLPAAWVPAAVLDLHELPLTPNHKLDRRALPPPETLPADRPRIAPRTPAEQLVTTAWSAVLERDDIAVDDDFFALGGHSLRALRVIARLNAETGADLSLRTLFANPTPAALAACLPTGRTGTPAAIPRRASTGPVPLSGVQRRLWFLERLRPGGTGYLVPSVVRLRGPLDTDRLAAGVRTVAARHDALRARFSEAGQVSGTPGRVSVSTADDAGAARALAEADASTPIRLGDEAPFRARIVRIAADDHVVVLVGHHAAVDGWSLRLIWRDIAAAYTGRALPPTDLEHADVAAWQQQSLVDGLDHWRQRLAGLPACELPTDHRRPATWSSRAGHVRFALPAAVSDQLRELARQRGATTYMVLLAAFELVLSWYAGQDEVVLGIPVTGRSRPELEDVVGCLVDTVVVRGDVSGNPPFAELVDRVRAALLADLAHQDTPFEAVVDALRPERDPARNPLFQVMFRTADATSLSFPGVRAEPWDVEPEDAKFDLDVSVDDERPAVCGTVEFAAELFEPATAQRLADAYTAVLTAAAADPQARLSALAPAPQPLTGGPAGGFVALTDRIAHRAADAPGTVALVHGAERVTYAELDARANRVAHWLIRQGITAESVVGVAVPRSPALVAVLLGILRAGAAYLPIDLEAPAAWQEQVLSDGGAVLLLTEEELQSHAADILVQPSAAPAVAVRPDQLFAIFFTSGSTGRPKGVATLHGGVSNFMDYLDVTAGDTVLQVAAVTFDASVRDLLGPLTAGATVVVLPDGAIRDPYAVLAAARAHSATALLSLVPTTLRMLTTAAGTATTLPDLRVVLVSGEPLTSAHVAAAHELAPGVRLVNQYGPTECTMISTFHPAISTVDEDVPVGRPIPGMRALVLGPRGEALPPGGLGELHLAGAGLTRGYVGRPGTTAAAWLPDPTGAPGNRMYATGDLVRLRPDGALEFHGRRDRQLKVRGMRVEPAEIEAALSSCTGVEAAAVALHHGELVGYVVGSPVDPRAELAERRPEHLVPSVVLELDRLPTTPHGKLDRAALPPPGAADRSPVAARDLLELRLTQVFERILGSGPVGVRDDFFARGGNSLRAVELVEAVRRDLCAELPLNAVFTRPTVEGLSAVLAAAGTPADDLIVPLAGGPAGPPPLFLVHPQSGDVCCYLHLARGLAGEVAVRGIESVGYNTDDRPLETIEAMAERYLTELTKVAPSGPYRLAGWSFGGNVAFELAARLEAAGERVGFLGIIDARAFGQERLDPWFQEYDEMRRFGMIAEVPADDLDALAGAEEQEALAILLRNARRKDKVPSRADTATLRRMVAVFTQNGRAADSYTTRHIIEAPIHLFKATDRHPTLTNPDVRPASWQARTRGDVHVRRVPGTHHDLVYPPNVDALAAAFRAAM